MRGKQKIFVGFDSSLDQSWPHGTSLIESFVAAMKSTWAFECPALDLFFEKDQPTGSVLAEEREAALNKSVGYIGLVSKGSNRGLVQTLNRFWSQPEFVFESPTPRIFLIGVERSGYFEFADPNSPETADPPLRSVPIAYTLSLKSAQALPQLTTDLVKEIGVTLRNFPKNGRVVLGLGTPNDGLQFRNRVKSELVHRHNFEVIDVQNPVAMPNSLKRQLRHAMRGASVAVHFLSSALDIGWLNSRQYFIDLQIDAARELQIPELFCSGPAFEDPRKTPTNRYESAFASTIKFDDPLQACNCIVQLADPKPDEPRRTKSICLVGENADQIKLEQIQDYLERKYSWKIVRPIPCADDVVYKAFQTHQYLLLYWGSGKKAWYETNIQDLISARLDVNRIDVDVAGVYFAKAKEDYKLAAAELSHLTSSDQITIGHYEKILAWDDFDPTQLQSFEDAVQQSGLN